jgi:hypothetical protein
VGATVCLSVSYVQVCEVGWGSRVAGLYDGYRNRELEELRASRSEVSAYGRTEQLGSGGEVRVC